MGMHFQPIREDFGAIVTGVDLREPVSDTLFADIADAHVRYGLLVFRDQQLEPTHEIDFARRFNKIRIYLGNDDTKLAGHPEINLLGNIVENGRRIAHQVKIGIEWHTDGTGFPYPPIATVLYCVEAPSKGGETLYASGKRAWEELPAARQRELAPMRVVYSFQALYEKLQAAAGTGNQLNNDERARAPDVEHPLVRTHSVTGNKALWFTQSEMKHFVGLSVEESEALSWELVSIISKPKYVYAHHWRPGDLGVWDNRWMHHSTTPYTYAHERRLMHRISGEGDEIPM